MKRTRVLALTEKGRVPAEEILFARWHMFSEVYWHRTTRAHEAVLAAAIRRLRPLSVDFDSWFRSTVLHPHTSDEWFLNLVRTIAGNRSEDVKLTLDAHGEGAQRLAHCKEMLLSLTYAGGRGPFKRLLSVSAIDDPDLYGSLQLIRNYLPAEGGPALEQLAEEFAGLVNKVYAAASVHPLDLVFDVPAKRAPANTVWMLALNSPARGRVRQLAERSSMWREFSASFHDQTRKIRIFVPAQVRERIRKTGGSDQLRLYELLREAALKVARVAVQLNLPGMGIDAA